MNKRIVLVLLLVSLMASGIITLQNIKADSRTIIVPDDYPTIAAAIGNATDGDTILVRKGTYEGAANQTLVIDKTISLIGEETNNTKLNFHPLYYENFIMGQSIGWSWAESIQIVADDVIISGFTIMSDGGYVVAKGNGTQIMNNIIITPLRMQGYYQIFAFNVLTDSFYANGSLKSNGLVELYGDYCRITGNSINGTIAIYGSYTSIYTNKVIGFIGTGVGTSGEGSSMISYNGYSNLIYANTVQNSGGIELSTDANIVANNTVTNCSIGVGIRGRGNANAIFRNIITNCFGVGLYKTESGGGNIFYANYVASNYWGAKIAYTALIPSAATLYHNNFVSNVQQQVNCDPNETITVAGMNFTRQLYHAGIFDNGNEGNYWSDYNGTDANGDGVGDTPYVIDANRADHYPLMSAFNISSVTIQIPEWANITTPNPIPNPNFPAQPTPSPTNSPTPSATSPSQSPSPSAFPTISPNPSPSGAVTPSASPSPTLSPSETSSPSPSVSQLPTQSQKPQVSTLPMESVYALAGAAGIIVAVVAVALFIRKRR